uniref:Uncharacterized protein n=1 Tax=Brassica campestris TaxID=3711 RepID=M4DC98_BRACM
MTNKKRKKKNNELRYTLRFRSFTSGIAEPWDYGGLYFVGEFPNWDGWAEWNGMYRDDVRRFMKGMKGSFATRVAGSSDLYQVNQRNPPYHGVNFIIAHDGFTLRDHTILRGNWQMKNFHLALMISQVKSLPTYMNDIVVNNLI